jgi:hypothetical protein
MDRQARVTHSKRAESRGQCQVLGFLNGITTADRRFSVSPAIKRAAVPSKGAMNCEAATIAHCTCPGKRWQPPKGSVRMMYSGDRHEHRVDFLQIYWVQNVRRHSADSCVEPRRLHIPSLLWLVSDVLQPKQALCARRQRSVGPARNGN